MTRTLLAIGAAAVAFTAFPAQAEKHYSGVVVCDKVKQGVCVAYKRLTRGAAAKATYDVGYSFGPSYSYTDVSTIPQTVVTEYGLSPSGRYVYKDGYLYEVDPSNYTVTRVIYTQPPQ
jgi:hypothetical protein